MLLARERDFSVFFFSKILFYSPSPAPRPLQENPSEGLRERAPKSLPTPQKIYNVKYFANVQRVASNNPAEKYCTDKNL